MVIASTSLRLQHSFNDLFQWAEENSQQMSRERTEMMIFR
jgi:hypothetical protein